MKKLFNLVEIDNERNSETIVTTGTEQEIIKDVKANFFEYFGWIADNEQEKFEEMEAEAEKIENIDDLREFTEYYLDYSYFRNEIIEA